MNKRIILLGVPIDVITADEAVRRLHDFSKGDRLRHVMTPNNEMLLQATADDDFHSVLCDADLCLPDSTGLVFAARHTGQGALGRVPGSDAFVKYCLSADASVPVFFLGAAEGVAEKAADALKKQNPDLNVVGTLSGSPKDEDAQGIVDVINDSGAVALFVAFGSPAQDMWIHTHAHLLTNVRMAMGIGGSFDFVAGNIRRAPSVMRKAGLEWAWRLLLQPSRIGRIFKAVCVFPFFILKYGKGRP